MKYFCTAFLFIGMTFSATAQKISSENLRILQKKEDSLKGHAIKLLQGINVADRYKADSTFTKMFVRALRVNHSFQYSFDSLYTISRLYAPDSSFRIFTWQMVVSDNLTRQHGAIQMKTADGSLKLFPLIDKSDITQNFADTIGNNYGWMGAVYYKVILTKYGDHNYYTLLGYDENNIRTNRKVIEVLKFNDGQPVFGSRIFNAPGNSIKASNPARYVMEYKKDAGPRLTYDESLNMIIMEHLISETNEPNKKWTLIGDGDYEGFKWQEGRWVYVSKIFNEMTPEGKAPVPAPLRDDKGNIDDTKLKEN